MISVDIIPSRNHLHPILSYDNAMCLNLTGASIGASSIVTVPRCRTYSTILFVKSGSVSASSSHRSSAVMQSWNASTRPTSGHRRTCSAVSTWIVQQGHLSHCPSRCLQLRFYSLPLYSSLAYTPRPETVGTPPCAVSGAHEANRPR